MIVCLKYIPLGTNPVSQINDQTVPSNYTTLPPTNFLPTGPTIYDALAGIDAALGALGGGGALTGVVNPTGVVVPTFVGQVYVNTANQTAWIATDATNTGWRRNQQEAQTGVLSPVGVTLPRGRGDVYIQAPSTVWIAYGLLNTEWVQPGETIATGVVSPFGVVLPAFRGQRYIDTVAGNVWVANGLLITDWTLMPRANTGGIALAPAGAILVGADNVWLGGVAHSFSGAPLRSAILAGDSNLMVNSSRSAILAGQANAIRNTTDSLAGGGGSEVSQAASLAHGANAFAYDGGEGLQGSVAFGTSLAEGLQSSAFGNSESIGDNSFAAGDTVRAVHIGSVAHGRTGVGVPRTMAVGEASMAVGSGNQAAGLNAFAGGLDSLVGSIRVYEAAAVANVGPNVEVTIVGADLTTRIQVGDALVLFDLQGGLHDPHAFFNRYYGLTVGAIVFALGNTTITINGFNFASPPATVSIGFQEQADYGFAFGEEAVVNTGSTHSLAFGFQTQTEGPYQAALGYQCNAGETSADEGAFAAGYQSKAFRPYSVATGRNAQTRNRGERAHASFQWTGIRWAQQREVFVGIEIPPVTPTDNLATDGVSGGDEIATFAGHGYMVTADVVGVVNTGGVARVTAAWRLEGLFKNQAGVTSQIGATITTAIANENALIFDTAPVFGVTGAIIRITCANDGTGTDTVVWFARVTLIENGG